MSNSSKKKIIADGIKKKAKDVIDRATANDIFNTSA
jgi:hypothetical protein